MLTLSFRGFIHPQFPAPPPFPLPAVSSIGRCAAWFTPPSHTYTHVHARTLRLDLTRLSRWLTRGTRGFAVTVSYLPPDGSGACAALPAARRPSPPLFVPSPVGGRGE